MITFLDASVLKIKCMVLVIVSFFFAVMITEINLNESYAFYQFATLSSGY